MCPKNKKYAVIGDFHSSFYSFYQVIKSNLDMMDNLTLKDKNYIFFLGDLVDRGPYSLEVLLFSFILKIKNPNNVFIINGNHEDQSTYNKYGFRTEFKNQFKLTPDDISKITKTMFFFSSAIYLKFNEKIYHLSHGAFDAEFGLNVKYIGPLDDLEEVSLKQFLNSKSKLCLIDKGKTGRVNQFKWGDFKQSSGYDKPVGGRGKFGWNVVAEYLKKNNIECMITGHQDQTPLGLIVDGANTKKSLKINDEDFENEGFRGYDFFQIPTKNEPTKDAKKTELFPNKENEKILAVITSSAVVPRRLCCNSYLRLFDTTTILQNM